MNKKVHSLPILVMGAVLALTSVATRTAAAAPAQDSDTTRPELANFDVFLDGHAAIARQLRNNPSLVNNEEYLENHPALQQYLANHPGVREELQENPRAFLRGTERMDLESRRPAGDRDRDADFHRNGFDAFFDSHPEIAQELAKNPSLADNPQFLRDHPAFQQFLQAHPDLQAELKENPQAVLRTAPPLESRENRSIPRFDISDFNLFLDGHPEIDQQLSKNPSLADDATYLKDHPALQQYMQTHPDLRTALTENPQSVMAANERWESKEPLGDVAGFDAFLDQHPQISRQLSKDPSLVRDQKYLQDHPELQQFLQTHPDLRAEMTENPNAIMQAEQRWEAREGNAPDDPGRASGGMGITNREMATFDGFLDSHPQVAQQLSKDPSLVNNEEFLENHPELQTLLKQNPAIQHQLQQNPQAFLKATVRTQDQHLARPEPKPLNPDPDVLKH